MRITNQCNRAECFAWTTPARYKNCCTALEEIPEGECPFFKTKGQVKDEKVAMKIRALSDKLYRSHLEEYGIKFPKGGRGSGE